MKPGFSLPSHRTGGDSGSSGIDPKSKKGQFAGSAIRPSTKTTKKLTEEYLESMQTLAMPALASPKSQPLVTNGPVQALPMSAPGFSLPNPPAQTIGSPPPQRLAGPLTEPPRINPAFLVNALSNPVAQPFPAAQASVPVPRLSRGKAAVLVSLLSLVIIHALTFGPTQFLSERGWAFVIGGSNSNNPNLLDNLHPTQTQDTQATPDPQQIVNQLISHMSLDQKIGQMMMVQFNGGVYAGELEMLITHYYAGSVMLLAGNKNIISEDQVITLNSQMQQANKNNGMFPLLIALDQEGGLVDRLADLRGAEPSAAEIGASNDPEQARAMGEKDAQDLAKYGIQLNLAPVVDVGDPAFPDAIVTNEARVYGDNAESVTRMAAAYLQGLQESGKTAGTLKHFPGLGSVLGDPHAQPTYQNRTQAELEQKDWAPYRKLIDQGLVESLMVTHTYLTQIDPDNPASLSPKVVQGIIRDELGFQGVIMTDSLSMNGITGSFSIGRAAALAIIAGSDIVMGADAATIGEMVDGIKQAINTGEISQQRIDDSVRRILLLKYKLGQLTE